MQHQIDITNRAHVVGVGLNELLGRSARKENRNEFERYDTRMLLQGRC